MCKLPNETGLYWARKNNNEDWDYIVNVKGQSPFLSYTLWSLSYPDRATVNGNNLVGVCTTTLAVSDEIDITTNNENIIQALNPGLYVLSSRVTTLALVTETAPYMNCYIWNVEKDIKEKHESPWLLPFVKYIEKPKVNK